MRRSLVLAAALLAGASPLALAGELSPTTSPANAMPRTVPTLAAFQQLPIDGLAAGETSDGQLVFYAANGRFLLRGQAVDVWTGQKIESFAQMVEAAGTLPLIPLLSDRWGEVAHFDLGSGPQEVVVFVDPLCPYCHELLAGLSSYAATHRFRLVVLGLLGEPSRTAARQLLCATDPGAALARLLAGAGSGLPPLAQRVDCDLRPLQNALAVATLTGIDAVPVMVDARGRLQKGLPQDLAGFLGLPGGVPVTLPAGR